jgi:hypothetical protein
MEENVAWAPYTGDGSQTDTSLRQTSNTRSVYTALSDLFQVVHDSLYILYSPIRRLHGRDILDIYTKYLRWYNGLTVTVRLGENSTPSVMFTQYVLHL